MEILHNLQYFSLKKVKRFLNENENNSKLPKQLTKLIFSDDPSVSMRASWTLQHLCFRKPDLIYPQIPQLIKFLKRNNNHSGAIRNVIRIFMEIELPEKYLSEIYDLCIGFIKNATLPHAVRVFSIYTAVDICKRYPELKHEILLIFSELKNYPMPPSMVACMKKCNKILEKIKE